MPDRGRRIVSNSLAFGVGLLLLTALVAVMVEVRDRPKSTTSKVMIGTKDEVYYSRGATDQEAALLGRALQGIGFFTDRGTSVLLSRNKGVTAVSFVLNEGGWNRAAAVDSFEQIGRHIANSVGGFPIEIRLVDSGWHVQRSMAVGKVLTGARDNIYYFGAATEGEARALGRALRDAGYLQDRGVSVAISKDGRTAVGFVVNDGIWEEADAVAGFAGLVRRVGGSVGGLPIELRLLNEDMEIKKEVTVQ